MGDKAPPSEGSLISSVRARRRRFLPAIPWVLLALFAMQFLIAFRPDALAWDGVFYYSYVRSVVMDGDLEMGNDVALSYDITPGLDFVDRDFHLEKTPTGRTANPFAVGTAVLWLPWYAAIAAAARLAWLVGLAQHAATGYELAFRWGMGVVSAVCGFVAVLASHRLAERLTSRWSALVAGAVAMFVTPLLYYQFREPFFGHAASAMVVALFVAAWWRGAKTAPPGGSSALLLGALGGAAALVRTQNLLYLILPLVTAMADGWPALRRRDWDTIRRIAMNWALVALGAFTVLTIQLAVWRVLYGKWILVPQGSAFMDWRAPWLIPVLLSSFKGLVPWMPVVLPALVGILLVARERPRLGIPLSVAFALQVYVNASTNDWFGGGGYGPRRFSNTLVVLLVGYAVLIDLRRETWYRLSAMAMSAVLVLHQWVLLSRGFAAQAGGRMISMSVPPVWEADGTGTLLRRLVGLLREIARNPVDALVLPDSPLAIAGTHPTLAIGQILLLVVVLGSVFGLLALVRSAPSCLRHGGNAPSVRRLATAIIAGVIVAADAWILLGA